MLVEKLHHDSFVRRQSSECAVEKIETAANVDREFELGYLRDQPFIDGIEMLERVTSAPVIAHFIMDDFHQQRPGMGYVTQPAKCGEGMERDFLFEVFVAHRGSRMTGGNAKHRSNIGKAEIHVTVLRSVRL